MNVEVVKFQMNYQICGVSLAIYLALDVTWL